MKKRPDITSLFEPKSIAVIGASNDPKKIGHSILSNVLGGGYRGAVYPVNPRGGEIMGLKAYASVAEIGAPVDSATIVIPSNEVIGAIRACADAGVKNAQVISSGFSEAGNSQDERELLRAALSGGMRILGPNTFGLYSSSARLNATFSATPIAPGPVAILTQSGALGIAMIGKTAVDNLGLSAIVSLGNKCDLNEADLLEYLIEHEPTKVILLYIEGVREGENLIRELRRATAVKPVLAIKSGRSRRGAMAAASHTGSLAGSDEIFDAVMKQCGVLRAESLDEAFNWCAFLAFAPKPKGRRCVIVTNGGGVGVMASDACEKYGIDLYDDQERLKESFGPVTPAFGSTKNPVDLTGAATSADYLTALTVPSQSETMDATIALFCETATFDSENLEAMIMKTYGDHSAAGKPIAFAVIGGEAVEAVVRDLKKKNIPLFNEVYQAVSCLGTAYRHRQHQMEPNAEAETASIDERRINAIIGKASADGRNFLLSDESTEILRAADIAVPESGVAHSIHQAVEIAETMGYPVVMKIVSRHILHKSDAGGVALNLLSQDEVVDAYEAIMHKVRTFNPDATIDGMEISRMAPPGLEMIIGARQDPSFGPIVMCGLGGIYVEVMKDVVFRALPLDRQAVTSMLKEIRSFPLLLGVRGEQRKDMNAVIAAIVKIGTVIDKCRNITDIEINPAVVYGEGLGIQAVDARILIKTPGRAGL
jgi:acetyltransferase